MENETSTDLYHFFSQFSFLSYCILITVLVYIYRLCYSVRHNPPIPPAPGLRLPVIGHLHLLDPDIRKSLRKYRSQLGNIYSIYFGGMHVVVMTGYDTLKEAFVKQADIFVDRPVMELIEKATKKRSFVTSSGQLWKEHRRFALSTLKDFGMGKSKLEGKIHEEITDFLQAIRAHSGKPFDPKEIVCTHVANIVCSLVFKGQFSPNDQRFMGMMKMVDENLEATGDMANFIPWLQYVPGDPFKFKKLVSNSEKLFEYCDDILAEHLETFNDNDIDDLTSAYIKETRRAEKNGEHTTMNLKMLSGLIADLFVAGSHTTSTAIRWAIPCLVQYPHVQKRLYQEISRTIGTERLPSVQDKASLGYLEAFTMEVLRFCDLTPIVPMHKASRDVVLHGFTIPEDAMVMPDLDSVFNSAEIWGDPENFRPERFLDVAGNFKKKDEMIAFFLGKRSCIGESLARAELMLFIGAIIQKFRLESPPGEQLTVEQVDGIYGIVHTPKPYHVVALAR